MIKSRGLVRLTTTLVQVFVLSLPLFNLCFNAVAYRLGLKDLATSVSGNTESTIDESTFLDETNDINKFALQSIYDFNYINKGQEIETYTYQSLYPSNDIESFSDFVNGNYYTFYINQDYYEYDVGADIDYVFYDNTNVIGFVYAIDEGQELLLSDGYLCNDIRYIEYLHIVTDDTYTTCDFYAVDSEGYASIFHLDSRDGDFLFYFIFQFNNSFDEDFYLEFNNYFIDYYGDWKAYLDYYTRQSTTSELIDIPSFINATEGMSYEEIVSNNYVNTHLLLNFDIVGLFTNNLSGNAYIYLWLNYYLNYLFVFLVVFLAFDVVSFFIFYVRKILDQSLDQATRG